MAESISISFEDLKELLYLYYTITYKSMSEQDQDPREAALVDYLLRWQSDLVATRLMENDTTVPLLTGSDMESIWPTLRNVMTDSMGFASDREETTVKHLFQVHFTNSVTQMSDGLSGSAVYNHMWKWAQAIALISQENGIPMTTVLSNPDFADRITREQYTKAQYLQKIESELKPYEDIDAYVDQLIASESEKRSGGSQWLRDDLIERLQADRANIRAKVLERVTQIRAYKLSVAERIYQTE